MSTAKHDPYRDLVLSNIEEQRDKYAEALRMVKDSLRLYRETKDAIHLRYADAVIEAAQAFHPMYAESWIGWPAIR